jgi:uncharacterized protein DUF3465
MQQLVKLLLLSLTVCLLSSATVAQKSSRKTRKPSPPSIICKLSSVPTGMVVVGYKRNSACADGEQLLVKRPDDGDIICAESPLPPKYSIATEAQGTSVGTCPKGAFLISAASARSGRSVDNDVIGEAFANGTSDIQVAGEGTVIRVLADDVNGSPHQRFIVQLDSGQTLLIAHNIAIAPRINGLEEGDSVRFYGEYAWNEKGGVIHWTHHDPRGRHVAGWITHNGKTYQ